MNGPGMSPPELERARRRLDWAITRHGIDSWQVKLARREVEAEAYITMLAALLPRPVYMTADQETRLAVILDQHMPPTRRSRPPSG